MIFKIKYFYRLTAESDFYYYLTGKIVEEGGKSWEGSRGWVKDLNFYDTPINIKDLVNTILLNNIPHHFPMVLEDVGSLLDEFAYWIGLKKIQRIQYKDTLYV